MADEAALVGNRGKSSRHPVALAFPDDFDVDATSLSDEVVHSNGRASARAYKPAKTLAGRANNNKPIFSSSVAAEILELHPRTLRIYEEEGLVVPFRTDTQRRRYSQNDIKRTRFIQFLTQSRRVNLEGVKIIFYMLDELRQLGIPDPVRHIFQEYREID
nr:MerR family protein [uncultured bacterium]